MRSIRFIRNTQTNTVSASGAISLLVPWKVSLTLVSMKSTTISTKACIFVGVPAEALRAALPNSQTKIRPRNSDQNMESTLIA